jgi:hypothetical protein
MKKLLIGLAVAASGALGAAPALAWHHHPRVAVGVGVGFGPYWGWPGPYWAWPGPYYYPAPYYYPPTVVIAQPPGPTQYVERAAEPQAGYWYYCETSRGYYPYVKECPSGWKAVPPAPPPAK